MWSTLIKRYNLEHIRRRKKSTLDFNPEPGCAICAILTGGADDEVILKTNYWRAVLAPDQRYLGRMFLTSRQHVGETEDLGFEAWMELRHVIWRLRGMAVNGLGATHMTHAFLMNNAYAEDPPCPHVHAHVRPRYRDRQIIDGIVFSDSAFGSHHKRGPNEVFEVTREMLATIGEKMRSAPVPRFGVKLYLRWTTLVRRIVIFSY